MASPPLFSGDWAAEHCVWMRLKEGAIGGANLAFMCDCMDPTSLIAAREYALTVTADYSIYWSGEPVALRASDWVLIRFTMVDWTGKWSREDGVVWSRDGRPLALSRQLRRVFMTSG